MKLKNRFDLALGWIERYTINGGIAVSSEKVIPYPEVTGYFIPSLLAWNEVVSARKYGEMLLACQLESGAWTDPTGNVSCIFDVGQIVRGCLALAQHSASNKWDASLSKAVSWSISFIDEHGSIESPDEEIWQGGVPLGVLLYALEPLRRAALYLNDNDSVVKIDKCIAWFLEQSDLTTFTHLSHFHAYIMEALFDLGHVDRCREGMRQIAALQCRNGAVPAYPDVSWVCSTGLFQYAIVWYKLGENERAHRAFAYATSLQNKSGGWYGSYGGLTRILPNRFGLGRYFARAEISWAVKYFLDALQLMLRASFEDMAHIFSEKIDPQDGRYKLISQIASRPGIVSVLDAGCGKGRYLRLLSQDMPHLKLTGADISVNVMSSLPESIAKAQGSLLSLPFANASFDMVYACESLEHAVHLNGALRELARVVRPGGVLCIIDKNIQKLGKMKISGWEQWFDIDDLSNRLQNLNFDVSVESNVPYEGMADGLFTAWIAVKR